MTYEEWFAPLGVCYPVSIAPCIKKLKVYLDGKLLKRSQGYTFRNRILKIKRTSLKKWQHVYIITEDSQHG